MVALHNRLLEGIPLDMVLMYILEEYWWLSIVTIPILALLLWLFYKSTKGKSARITTNEKKSGQLKAMLFLVVLNFGIWGVGTVALHGDAINGKSGNNKYYLGWKGKYTEVTRGIYLYSWIHTCLTIASFPAVILLFTISDIRERKMT
jgi:nitrate reductase NapE component